MINFIKNTLSFLFVAAIYTLGFLGEMKDPVDTKAFWMPYLLIGIVCIIGMVTFYDWLCEKHER